ncbi:MAG TPA: HlyD family secretion protein [Gemmatimonadaceae bacterium]|nr:HlyD family secretion protein [Gemmatimonadaceae bacterium]
MATQIQQDLDRDGDRAGTATAAPPAAPSAPARAGRRAESTSRRRPIMLGLVAIAAIAALIWGWQKWSYARVHESTDNAQVDGHVLPVLAKVGGYVESLRVEENQPVHAGDTLLVIDDADYRLRLAQAEAELQAAQAAVGVGDAPGQARAAVAEAAGRESALEAQIAAAQATLTRANADLARAKELAAKQIVSRQALDAAQAAADQDAANLRAVQRQAEAAGSSVAQARAGVRLAQARLEAARVARDNAALQLSYTHVVAPASGTVARRQVEPGQLVQPGQPLLSIVADTGVWVTANFKETQLAGIRVGSPAEIEVDAYPDCTVEARVESIGSATGARFALLPPDNATGNFTKVVQRIPVRLEVLQGCGEQRPLRPGMSTEVSVLTR